MPVVCPSDPSLSLGSHATHTSQPQSDTLSQPCVSRSLPSLMGQTRDMMRGSSEAGIVQGRSLISPMRVQFGHGVKTEPCVCTAWWPPLPLLSDEGTFTRLCDLFCSHLPTLLPSYLPLIAPTDALHVTFLPSSQQPRSKSSDLFCTPLCNSALESFGSSSLL